MPKKNKRSGNKKPKRKSSVTKKNNKRLGRKQTRED